MSDLFALAFAHQQAGRLDEAIAVYRHLLTRSPGDGRARLGLALALLNQQKPDDAADVLRHMAVAATAADVYFHLGLAFQSRLRFADAAEWFARAGSVRPDFAEAIYNLGLAQQNQGQVDAAIASYRRALELRPDMREPRQNLAMLLQALGQHAEALQVYRDGSNARPGDPDFPRYCVAAMYYDPATDNESRFVEAERFGARLRLPIGRRAPEFAGTREPERRLRVGYLTSDFKDHPVGRNMELLLASRDRTRFESIVYAEIPRPDATTTRLQGLVDAWRSTVGLDDATVADQIRADGIDILVCLAGHFDLNRPTVAAYRPAPIQISFHDACTSGGDGTFGYLIADRVVAPPQGAERFTERVLRLPSLYLHARMPAPVPGPLPCLRHGYVTFGCLNNPAKLSNAALAVWAQILLAVPQAHLVFKYRNWFNAAELKTRILSIFSAFGVSADRLEFLGAEDSLSEHLRVYDRIDIALDPFPFAGSTATFEALWMGVPVVTLAGSTMMGRWSASMLKALRLDPLIAETPERYVAIARDLATNGEALAALRGHLRQRIEGSPLTNGSLRARQLERLYRALWRGWCRAPATPDAVSGLFVEAQRHHREGRAARAAALYRRILSVIPDHAGAFHYLGVLDLQAGRYHAAEDRLRHALALNPRDASAQVNFGHVLHNLTRFAEAEQAFRAALAIDPFRAGALVGLGEALRAQGRIDEAVVAARKAVAIEPANAAACDLLGVALQDCGKIAEALDWLRKALDLQPDDARAQYHLAVGLQAAGRTNEAMVAYRRVLVIDPKFAEAHNNLGLLLIDAGNAAAAVDHLAQAAELRPAQALMHNNLGKALQHLGRVEDALALFEKAITADAALVEAHVNAGAAQRALGRYDAALACLRHAVELKPDLTEAHVNLGLALRDLGRLDEALEVLERALARAPDLAELRSALGIVLNDLGLHRAARDACQRAVALKPDSISVRRNFLAVLVYGAGVLPDERFREHRRFGAMVAPRSPAAAAPYIDGEPQRRLRVGYVSSDLCKHPVGRNLRPILANHDRRKFEIFAYATGSVADPFTDHLRTMTDSWRLVAGLSDREVADAVRADRIDVLVHLAGRFDRNQPGVAAHRPAPVQVSFHDPATSGVPGMDYLIADRMLVPRDQGERFSERVVRLPSFYIHDPLPDAPPVGSLPAREAGFPTFGIFNNPAKLSDESLDLWADVLRRIPGARLVFKFRDRYQSAKLCERVRGRLARAGVPEDRIEIIAQELPQEASLAIYNRVDLALDPHPFTGSTTTFESLWMGVPVITLATNTMVGRWSASMLRAVGLEELVASTPTAYVAAAVRLSSDPDRLAALRGELRARVAASPLCDGQRRTRQLERLFRALCRVRCGSEVTGFRGSAD